MVHSKGSFPPSHLQAPGNHTTMQHRHEANLADPRSRGARYDDDPGKFFVSYMLVTD